MPDFDFSTIVDVLRGQRIRSAVDVASISLLVYDYFLTLDREKRCVWPARWNISKVLFFLTRYLVWFDMIVVMFQRFGRGLTVNMCKILYHVSGYSFAIGISIAEIILALRTWAIWGNNKKIGILLLTLFIGLWVVVAAFIKQWEGSLIFLPREDMPMSMEGCIFYGGSKILIVEFIILVSFESVILTLALIKGFQNFRYTSSRFVSAIFRDGILYFIYLFAFSASNIVFLAVTPGTLNTLLSTLQRVVHSILSARILLHLREVANETALHSTSETDGDVISTTPQWRSYAASSSNCRP